MAYITQFATNTVSNTNLTAATLVATITNTTRIRKLWVNIFADQVKGTGDYIAHILVKRAGAGSSYESIKTTKTAGAGVTSIYFGSIPITLNATDVMYVYIIGLATDNDTTADVIVDVNEEWADIDASGRVELTSAAVDAILDEVVEGSLTFRQMLRLFMAVLANKSSGGGTSTIIFRDLGDTKARITATIGGAGNRNAVTIDGS